MAAAHLGRTIGTVTLELRPCGETIQCSHHGGSCKTNTFVKTTRNPTLRARPTRVRRPEHITVFAARDGGNMPGETGRFMERVSASPLPSEGPYDNDIIQQPLNTIRRSLQAFSSEVTQGFGMIVTDSNPAAALWKVLAKEAKTVYLMTRSDIFVAITPYPSIAINILTLSPFLQAGDYDHFWLQAATTVAKEILYGFLFLYSFNLGNQYMGAPGDLVDKPWRPISTGLLTRESALARCLLVNLLYTFVSWHLGVLPWALAWQIVNLQQFKGYDCDGTNLGLARSLAMWLGSLTMCYVGVQIAMPGPLPPAVFFWALTRGAMVGNHHWLQDFRDVDGDRKIKRITVPIQIGVDKARKLMAYIFLVDPIFMHFVVLKDSHYTPTQLVCEGIMSLISAAIAYRILNFRTAKEDHITYHWGLTAFYYNFSLLLLSPGVILSPDVVHF